MPSKCQLCLVSCQELFYDSIFSRHFFKRLALFGESFIEEMFYLFFFFLYYIHFLLFWWIKMIKRNKLCSIILIAEVSKVLPTKPTLCFWFKSLKLLKSTAYLHSHCMNCKKVTLSVQRAAPVIINVHFLCSKTQIEITLWISVTFIRGTLKKQLELKYYFNGSTLIIGISLNYIN